MSTTEINSTSPGFIPTLKQARSLYIHTGNIVNSSRRKIIGTSQSATHELSECISSTIQAWEDSLSNDEKLQLQDMSSISCLNKRFLEPLPEEERNDYKITVKIFTDSRHKDATRDAVRNVLSDLGISSVETVILSLPEEQHCLKEISEIWRTLEDEVDAHRVYSLGISDLNKEQLEQLYDTVKVKPIINQVNLNTCCVIPQDLADYAREHDVQLLTHNDPAVILSDEDFQSVIRSSLPQADNSNWRPSWVARYSVLIKARGVIKKKGFIVAATKVDNY